MDKVKRITMSDMAKQLGVSKNSISLALNGKKGISKELRKQILETAARMNYGGVSSQSELKRKCIIVFVPEYLQNDSFFYSDIYWAIENEAKNADCISINISISRTAEKNLELPSLPIEMNIIGFLVIGVVGNAYIKLLADVGYPIIAIDIPYNNLKVSAITTSSLSGGFMATQYLIDKGHKKIGFIGPIYSAQSIYERYCGFKQALEYNHLNNMEQYHIIGEKDRFVLFDTTDTLGSYFDEISDYPTAWFCGGDRIAVALMNLLASKNISIPEQISVIGFDDIPIAEMVFPKLTTMHVERKLMGKLAVEYILHFQSCYSGLVNLNLTASLVERDSVRQIE